MVGFCSQVERWRRIRDQYQFFVRVAKRIVERREKARRREGILRDRELYRLSTTIPERYKAMEWGKRTEEKKQKARDWHWKQRAKGLCLKCGLPMAEGDEKWSHSECMKKANDKRREKRAEEMRGLRARRKNES